MPTFGDYETIGEPIESREEKAHFTRVWQARRINAEDGRLYAVKCYIPRRRQRAEGEGGAALEEHGSLEFLEGVKQIKKATIAGRKCLTPIHDFGLTPTGDGAWYVTDFYGDAAPILPRTLRSYITRGGRVDGAALRHAIHDVVQGCMALQRSRGYSHGNLKPSNVFRAGKPSTLRKTPLLLGDAFPVAPLLLAQQDAQSKLEVDNLLKESMEAHDLRAIGELMLQLVEVRLLKQEGDYDYPVSPSPAWSRLGKDCERWRDLCNRLLDPNLSLERMNFDLLDNEVRPGLVSKCAPLAAGAAVLLCLAVAGYFVWHTYQKGHYTVDAQANPPQAGIVSGAGSFATNSLVTVTAMANSGYTFTNWTENGTWQTNSPSYTFTLSTKRHLVANFTTNPQLTYTVTASAKVNGSISPNGPQTVVKGGSVAFTAVPASGYVVNQWMVNSSPAQSDGASYTLNNVTASASVQVTFKPAPLTNYTVTASAGANGSIRPDGPQTVVKGGSVAFAANPASGYVVNQWMVNSSPTQSGGASYTLNNVAASASVQVTFKAAPPANYTVTASAGANGSISPNGPQTVVKGGSVAFTAAPASGYVVNQWMVNSSPAQSDGTSYTLNNVAASASVQVTFKPAPLTNYTVTASAGANGSISPSGPQTVVKGGSVAFTAAPASGYMVNQWLVNSSSAQSGGTSYALNNITAAASVQVTFRAAPPTNYTVTASAGANGSISPSGPQAVVKGGSFAFTAAPASGYVVNQWLVNSSPAQSDGTSYTLNNVTASASVQVTFKPAPLTNYTVTASAGANGSISPSGPQAVVKGGSFAFTAAPASGYVVNQWLVNSSPAQSDGTSYTLNNVTASASVQVTFKPAPLTNYTVTASAGANGSISPNGPQAVVKGGSVAFTAAPASGYVVNQWLVNSSPAQSDGTSYTLNNVAASASVQVTFKPAPLTNYTVTASAGANGSISPSGPQTVVKGGSVAFTAAPASGYVVNQWLVNSSPAQSDGASYTLNNVAASASVQVTFRAALPPTDHRPTNFSGVFDKSIPDLDFVWLDGIGRDRRGAYVAVNELSWGQFKALGGTNMPAVSSLSPNQPAAWSGQVGLANARSFVELLNNSYAAKQVKFRLPGLDEYANLIGVTDFSIISNLVVADRSDGESFVGSAVPRDITNIAAALAKGLQATNRTGLRNVIGNVREWTANSVPFGYAYSWGYYHSPTNKPLEDEQIGLRLICEPTNR
jgi:DUF917 family protein